MPITLLLVGCTQHVAQAISLIAQIPPTSLSGFRRYWAKGSRSPTRWLLLIAIGFLLGSVAGALAASSFSDQVLRWTFVGYLLLLDALLIFRAVRPSPALASEDSAPRRLAPSALILIGLVAGLSSGFMGIGGGLAMTVGLVAALKVPQHQAQAASLALTTIPLTIPGAWVYWQQGWPLPWTVIAGVIVGLWAGCDLGARLANRLEENALRVLLIGLISMSALYMAYRAVT